MTTSTLLQSALVLAAVIVLAPLLGGFIARVYLGQRTILTPLVGPLERLIYRLIGVPFDRDGTYPEMTWQHYALALLVFNAISIAIVFLLGRLQGLLPLNPQHFAGVTPDLAFNTGIGFNTTAQWQSYAGETTLGNLAQSVNLAVGAFVGGASGMAVLVPLSRAFTRTGAPTIGNFWVDLTRSMLYVLLPLSVGFALVLASQGVVQTFGANKSVTLLQATTDTDGGAVITQPLAVGPVASLEAAKMLTNGGGGYYNTNSAHPYENPTPLTNFVEVIALLLLPVALCLTFGQLAGSPRQGWSILAAMLIIFVPLTLFCATQEQRGTPQLAAAGADLAASATQSGGNMEGKEVRFGAGNSAFWACATTATGCGAVDSMHDSFTPLGGMAPLMLMGLGEVVFGGLGTGLCGMLVFVILTAFIGGLMIGRTPELLGKKLGAFEIKMAALVVLIPTALSLLGTALALMLPAGRAGIFNPGSHGLTEVLYNLTSACQNNGSALAGMSLNSPFYNILLGIGMFIGRFWTIIPLLAIAGSIADKKTWAQGPGTLSTNSPFFTGFLVLVTIIVGALNYIPALALGPLAEHLQMLGGGAR